MTEQRTYVLVAIVDNSLFGQWSFIAASEIAVAEMLLSNPFAYENVFWGLRLNMSQVGDMDPRKLLERIRSSYSQPRALAVYHLFAITPAVATADSELATTS